MSAFGLVQVSMVAQVCSLRISPEIDRPKIGIETDGSDEIA